MKQITLAELPELVQNLINQTLKTGELLIAIIESVRYTPIDPPKSPLKRGTLKISGSPLFKGGWGGSK
ncbi:MAG: hypothetical protein SXA11_25655, partial [Cyanobacteriota bacterium]|nr:hypothetical protein [Cyanobacteriota bacterium]